MAKDKERLSKDKIKLVPNQPQEEVTLASNVPEPETKEYKRVIVPTELFTKLFVNIVKTLPYNTVLKNDDGEALALKDLVAVIENNTQYDINLMNKLISFITTLPFYTVRDFMSYVENSNKQGQLWTIKVV